MARATRPPSYTKHEYPSRLPTLLRIIAWFTCLAAIALLLSILVSGLGSDGGPTPVNNHNSQHHPISFYETPVVTCQYSQMVRFEVLYEQDYGPFSSITINTHFALYLNSGCFHYVTYNASDPFYNASDPDSDSIKNCQRMRSFSAPALAYFGDQGTKTADFFQRLPQTTIRTTIPFALLVISTILLLFSLTFHALTHISKRPGWISLSPRIGSLIVILTSFLALILLCPALAILTHSIDNFISSLTEYEEQTHALNDDYDDLIYVGTPLRGKMFTNLIRAATGMTAITFVASTLEYMMLLHQSYRQRKLAAYNSNPAQLPGETQDIPPEYAPKSEGVQQEVGEVGPEAIALREYNIRDSGDESPISPIMIRSRPGSQGSDHRVSHIREGHE